MNDRRRDLSKPLHPDAELERWIESLLPTGQGPASGGEPVITASLLLERLQDDIHGVAAASAEVFRVATRREDWSAELLDWPETTESSYTHLAIVTRADPRRHQTTIWAILAQRLPQFRPELLSRGVQHFHHHCAHCSRGYNGRFFGGDRILLLECPHCEKDYDILAVNTQSHNQRANTYFSHLSTPVAFPPGLSRHQELTLIWNSVLDHCEYRNDYDPEGTGPATDSWQTSAEILQCRSGDCEDTSILPADWLISRGIEARVVIGETEDLQGHAWCVAKVDDQVYLLETTVDAADVESTPPLGGKHATSLSAGISLRPRASLLPRRALESPESRLLHSCQFPCQSARARTTGA